MCGIAGFIGAAELPAARVQRTLALMRNRGPDHQDFVHFAEADRHVYLLHSRLSIIDLADRANQPFTVGASTLVYNGEIYNYRELRARLSDVAWQTSSDTEVLLQYYRRQGARCVEQFEGMWAFALYDGARRELLLSRDRFGEKPLYYWQRPEGLYFGSELKFLWALADARPPVNTHHLRRYLVNGYRALFKTGDLYYQQVQRLPQATTATVDAAGRLTLQRYWQPVIAEQPLSLAAAIAGFKERFLRSVELRLRADVPLAFCLSGGVDSTSIVCTAARVFGYRVATFSLVDSDERYNERPNMQATVAALGCDHLFLEVTPTGQLDRLRRLIAYHDGPLVTISYLIHSMISEAVAQRGFRVVCSGTAADELVTGYYDHFLLHLREMRHHPAYAQRRREWETHILPVVRNPCLRNPDLFQANPDFADHLYLDCAAFSSYLTAPFAEPYTKEEYTPNRLRNQMLNELFHDVIPPILHEDDLNSMMVSLENRSPFLDRELMEFAFSIPTEHLIVDGYAKYVLRQAMAGIVPDQVRLDRQKKGFNASINSVVDFADPATQQWILADSPVYELVHRAAIQRLLAGPRPLSNSFSKFFFSFLNAKLFLEQSAS